MDFNAIGGAGLFVILVVVYFASCVRIVLEYERGVVFRVGRVLHTPKGPGIILVFWPIDRFVRISLRTFVSDVPSQDVITRDNVSVKVNAVVYYRVMDPLKAVLEVEDFMYATGQLSQTTLRSILGQAELDDLLSDRERINRQLQEVIDQQTDPWGVKVSAVEVKHVDLPDIMQRAMARQAEAERDRRAKVIHAEGEQQASEKLSAAAAVLGENPMSLQLRFLQTIANIGNEKSSIIVLPIPVDLLATLSKTAKIS
jgi:regulator of protease activity HflC (stomatin/prohibitin superfamily)